MQSTPKRPLTSASEPPRSKKRAKYTQLACNECKRRKLKCDGQAVCARCVRQNVHCVYTPSSHASGNCPATPSEGHGQGREEGFSNKFRTVDHQIESLHHEMRVMSARMRELESVAASATATPVASQNGQTSVSSSSVSAGLQRILRRPGSPDYIGPTSAEFGIGRKRNLNTPGVGPDGIGMGMVGEEEESDGEELDSESTTAPSPAAVSDVEAMSSDPLGCLGKEEALRLVDVYENNVGLIYPCIDLDSVRSYVEDYFKESRAGPTPPGMTDQDWFFARDAEVLKILLATALLAESHGRSERAALLADSVENRFASRFKVPEVDMKELLILTLLSIFHSYRDDEVIAWRIIGLAVRGALQLGLHRQETWLRTGGVFPGELQWTFASRLFWCIYVLDRKWSFGTGLPFAIQDSDMDTNLPEPGAATPYLTCMINYARLSTKIWGLVMGWRSRTKAATADYCSYLDFQVQQWIQSIPRELRFEPERDDTGVSDDANRMTMLQVLLALQANQLRILVYRQNLLSAESIDTNTPGASIAVETAKSTVHMLDYFSKVSDIYFQRPEPFNYFLISALAALFLAVLHKPGRFSSVCQEEFYTAVDLVRRSSTRAHMSRRLQKIIRSLKLIRLNLDGRAHSPGRGKTPVSNSHTQTHLGGDMSPAVTLSTPGNSHGHGHGYIQHHSNAGLMTPTPQQHPIPGPGVPWPPQTPQITWDENSCEDLTSFFEMAGGLYFDPRVDPTLSNANSHTAVGGNLNESTTATARGGAGELPSQSVTDALGAFEAEDEALTRVMAGLL